MQKKLIADWVTVMHNYKMLQFPSKRQLFYSLKDWLYQVSLSKDKYVIMIAKKYYDYYLQIDYDDYETVDTNLDLDELTKYYYFQTNNLDFKTCIDVTEYLLWNLIAFISNTICPSCNQEYLKILTTKERINIFYSCDNCLAVYNKELNIVSEITDKLIPVQFPCNIIL
jgi:hypothetical protein